MNQWWRAYNDSIDNPKLGKLSDRMHRAWYNLCCLASGNDGALPPIDDVAFKLRMTAAKARAIIDDLIERRLFDRAEDGSIVPHNWTTRQYKNDVTDPTNAQRQKRYRDSHRNGRNGQDTVTEPLRNGQNAVTDIVTDTVTVTDEIPLRDRYAVTDQSTETETESKKEKKEEDAPCGAPSPPGKAYAFESGVIRLNSRDFEQWKANFSHIDVGAELLALTEWAGQQRSWFNAVKGALAKKNQQARERKDKLADQDAIVRNRDPPPGEASRYVDPRL